MPKYTVCKQCGNDIRATDQEGNRILGTPFSRGKGHPPQHPVLKDPLLRPSIYGAEKWKNRDTSDFLKLK